MKVPLLNNLALCSLVLGKVFASESSSESVLISPNEMVIENGPAFFADRFNIDGLELIEAKPEELEWFQGLTTLTDQVNVEIALAIGLVMQEALSGDVKMTVLKHVSVFFNSLPKDIQSIFGNEALDLAIELNDFETCVTLVVNNPSFFKYHFNYLSFESSSEIVKQIYNISDNFTVFLEEIITEDLILYFSMIYSGIPEMLFMEAFTKAIKASSSSLISTLFKLLIYSASRSLDKTFFIERLLPILGIIKADLVGLDDTRTLDHLQSAIDYIILYYEILKSNETRIFDEVIRLFNLRIDSTNDHEKVKYLELLAYRLAVIDFNSFLKLQVSNGSFLKNERAEFLAVLKDPLVPTILSISEAIGKASDHIYYFESMELDVNEFVNFRFVLRDDCPAFFIGMLPREIISQVKRGSKELSDYLANVLDAHPDLDEKKAFEIFNFISDLFPVNDTLYYPSFKVMKSVAFSSRLNVLFMTRGIVFKPEIRVLVELVKYSASIGSDIVLDRSVCNFYSERHIIGNIEKLFPQYNLYKHLSLPIYFRILESLSGVSFSEAYLLEIENRHNKGLVHFHKYRIAFKDWFAGPNSESLKEIKAVNEELYQMILQDNI